MSTAACCGCAILLRVRHAIPGMCRITVTCHNLSHSWAAGECNGMAGTAWCAHWHRTHDRLRCRRARGFDTASSRWSSRHRWLFPCAHGSFGPFAGISWLCSTSTWWTSLPIPFIRGSRAKCCSPVARTEGLGPIPIGAAHLPPEGCWTGAPPEGNSRFRGRLSWGRAIIP